MIPTVNLHSRDSQWKTALLVYYDIEFSGNIRSEFGIDCSIFEIALCCKKEELFCMINPHLSKTNVHPTVDPKYKMLSKEEYSRQTIAVPFEVAYYLVTKFVNRLLKKHKKKWVCMISHNGFRSDKVVLEHEVAYHKLPPLPYFFFDSLLYLREVQPGLESYSRENLYKHLFKVDHDAHNARADTNALVKIFRHINQPLHGVLYAMNTIPWRNSRGIGFHIEQSLLFAGIYDIVQLYRGTGGDLDKTREILSTLIQPCFSEKLLENIYYWYKLAEIIVNRELLLNDFPPLPTQKA